MIFFSKYSGAGNTFFLIDSRSKDPAFGNKKEIIHFCSSADGVIFLEDSTKADFRMRIFNRDGSEAEMCGNGLRCFVRFLKEKGLIEKGCSVESEAGIHVAKICDEEVEVTMTSPNEIQWNLSLTCENRVWKGHFLNTGVPHFVTFLPSLKDLQTLDILRFGKALRTHPFFPKGTNVNFVFHGPKFLHVRTFERGVEAETLACGTGATASALTIAYLKEILSPILVEVQSKEILTISFKKNGDVFSDISLKGPAIKLEEGALPALSFK